MVQIGTQTVLEQVPMELIEKGVVFTDFYSALEEIPEVIERYFGKARPFEEDRLAAYHTAYFNSGAVLYIPDNVEITQPIEGLFIKIVSLKYHLISISFLLLERMQKLVT